MDKRAAAIILAGGSGTRFGGPVNKVFRDLDGRPVLAHSLETFRHVAGTIVVVRRPADHELLAPLLQEGDLVAEGGDTRTASERSGLEALRLRIESGDIDVVAIHDGARPFVTAELCVETIVIAREVGGAIPGLSAEEEHEFDNVDEYGGQLYRVQTPQSFRALSLLAATDASPPTYSGRDTAQLVREYSELQVAVVTGDPSNMKLTVADDLAKKWRRSD